MKHRAHNRSFGRKSAPRAALMKGLVSSLVEHERIKTTLPKAKELRRHVEKAITRGKQQDVHSQRLLSARYPFPKVVSKIMKDLAVRFKDRPGGYTRIIKLGPREGDRAPMAFIEFTDYNYLEPKAPFVMKSSSEVDEQAAKKKKRIRKISNQSRRLHRERLQ